MVGGFSVPAVVFASNAWVEIGISFSMRTGLSLTSQVRTLVSSYTLCNCLRLNHYAHMSYTWCAFWYSVLIDAIELPTTIRDFHFVLQRL
jgi:hypothetical protein